MHETGNKLQVQLTRYVQWKINDIYRQNVVHHSHAIAHERLHNKKGYSITHSLLLMEYNVKRLVPGHIYMSLTSYHKIFGMK